MAKFGLYKIIRTKTIDIHGKKIQTHEALSRMMVVLNWKNIETLQAELQAADRLEWSVSQENIAFSNEPDKTTSCYIILNQNGKFVSQELASRIDKGGQIIKTGSDKDF